MCPRILIKDIHVCSVLIIISQVFFAITNNVALCVMMHVVKTFPGLYSEERKCWICASPISIAIAQMLTLGEESLLSGLQPSRRVFVSLYSLLLFFSHSFTSDSLRSQSLKDCRDCSTPGFPVLRYLPSFCSNSCPLSQRCHPTISSSVIPFSSCL